MIRADHPANSKRGGACMYYKNCLPLKVLDIRFLRESIAFELQIGDKLCSFVSHHRLLNQSSDDFSYDDFVSFLDNFELTLDSLAQKNPFLMVALGDFKAKSSNCYKGITSDEGRKTEALTSQNGLHQETNEPTHILNDSSSCIDLIFNSQPNLLIKPGVHPSLHPKCHHQIIFAKFNLDIVFPPPYEREIWHYQKSNIDLIKRAINSFDWEKAFPILMLTRWSLFLIKLLSIYYIILFLMRRSYVMTEIPFG